jgi:hypothetical protein
MSYVFYLMSKKMREQLQKYYTDKKILVRISIIALLVLIIILLMSGGKQ